PTALRFADEAVKGLQCHIFLVGSTARPGLESLAGQPHQAREVALPELRDRVLVALHESADQASDGPYRGHRQGTSAKAWMRGQNSPAIVRPEHGQCNRICRPAGVRKRVAKLMMNSSTEGNSGTGSAFRAPFPFPAQFSPQGNARRGVEGDSGRAFSS